MTGARRICTVVEVARSTGLDAERIDSFIAREWISPCTEEPHGLDEEDVARAQLIEELQRDFGANDEAVPLILHLLDQLHYLRRRLRQLDRPIARSPDLRD